jgi:moderate conductance mechanosensitive channel
MMLFMQISLPAELRRAEVWLPWIGRGVRVLVILAGAWLITGIAGRLLHRLRFYTASVINRHGETSNHEMEKRAATIISVLRKLISSLVWMVALVMALTELTFNIEPLLAGLGVAGLALGLGAQTIIKDWLGGFFLLLEDQIRIGDSVIINGISGVVEEINLRTTVLRGESGAVNVIPNGSITTLANLTREYSYYIFETVLGYGADIGKALEILKETGAEIASEEPYHGVILAPLEVFGVDRLSDRGPVIRARIKTLPSKQYMVGRELNRRVKLRFDHDGIRFPAAT